MKDTATVAQLVEQRSRKAPVAGSSPASGSIKVEDVPVDTTRGALTDFAVALRDLQVGQSFVHYIESHHRVTISVLQALYPGRKYACAKVDPKAKIFRVGRLA
jgi:hypothetical protein